MRNIRLLKVYVGAAALLAGLAIVGFGREAQTVASAQAQGSYGYLREAYLESDGIHFQGRKCELNADGSIAACHPWARVDQSRAVEGRSTHPTSRRDRMKPASD